MISIKEQNIILQQYTKKYPKGTLKNKIISNENCVVNESIVLIEIPESEKTGTRHYVDAEGNRRTKELIIMSNICFIFDENSILLKIELLNTNS